MRVLGSLLFIGLFLAGCSDLETVKNKDEEGNLVEQFTRRKADYAREGLYRKFYPSGKLQEQANFHNDTLEGERRLFYENGQVQIVEQYVDGQFHGPYRTFYENGQADVEGEYVDNSMQGFM